MASKKNDPAPVDGLDIPAASVEIRPLDSLAAYARNARTHDDANVAQLMGSIIEFGFTNPVLADADGIIAGHGRCMAARKLYEQGKVIRLPNGKELPKGTVPVLDVSGWSEAKRRAYILADNRLALASDWDYDMLAVELDELRDMDFDLSLLGFEQQELNDLIGTPNLGPAPVEGEDDAPEPPANPATIAGDVWLLGKHRLMCGDSTDAGSVAMLMDGGQADVVFTDPPYGMSYDGGRSKKQFGMIANDDAQGDDLIALVRKAVASAKQFSKGGAAAYICFPWRTYSEFEAAVIAAGFEINACIVWDKKSIGLGHQDYRPQHEFIFYSKGGQFYGDRSQSDVWYMSRGNTGAYVHPTQKPVELIERALLNSSKQGDTAIDCFGGSGSTLIACEKTGRAARLMELDERYCDVIVRRWQEFTGQHATLEGDGRTFDDIAQERVGESAEA